MYKLNEGQKENKSDEEMEEENEKNTV